jgi:hypothetical protein
LPTFSPTYKVNDFGLPFCQWNICGRLLTIDDAFSIVAQIATNNLFSEWTYAKALPITDFIRLIEAIPKNQ